LRGPLAPQCPNCVAQTLHLSPRGGKSGACSTGSASRRIAKKHPTLIHIRVTSPFNAANTYSERGIVITIELSTGTADQPKRFCIFRLRACAAEQAYRIDPGFFAVGSTRGHGLARGTVDLDRRRKMIRR
jgi:hypothetical protein